MAGPTDTVTLTAAPALTPLLLRGALRSPFRRPAPDAAFPRTRLLLPGLRVDLVRLAAYERVCGFPTGEPDLPVTYPHVLGFPLAMRLMSGRDFPLPLPGLVHTSIEIVRGGVLPADAAYDLSVRVEGLAEHRRGTEATVVTGLRLGGDVVWESRSTYLARHGSAATGRSPRPPVRRTEPQGGPHGAPPRLPEAGTAGPAGTGRAGETPAEQAGEVLAGQLGEAPAGQFGEAPAGGGGLPPATTAEWRLGGDVGRRYGAASGDRNPIHLHPLTARLFGFPRAVAHGMWTVARCLAAHGTPDATEVRARFRAPVLLPGTVAYEADGTGRFALRGPDGRLHVSGEVRPPPGARRTPGGSPRRGDSRTARHSRPA
ncbi:MaoC/PaaZ C-terminal domain-containing protein [Streptomyces sp. SP2-10]|uniref:MaoC/PaaZ C-terminal domain-containing protein n=1 Tax=Streptomyces sp. SP2-10 TaxID=2873385 RepID=UPI00223B09E3|nr:MaoC/PaaZ C-terminal domain-containing protein [Streptomyces sp. SP2-10]